MQGVIIHTFNARTAFEPGACIEAIVGVVPIVSVVEEFDDTRVTGATQREVQGETDGAEEGGPEWEMGVVGMVGGCFGVTVGEGRFDGRGSGWGRGGVVLGRGVVL